MRQPVVLERNAVAYFFRSRDTKWNRSGWCRAIARRCPRVMRERTEGESGLVDILSVSQQRLDEIALRM